MIIHLLEYIIRINLRLNDPAGMQIYILKNSAKY